MSSVAMACLTRSRRLYASSPKRESDYGQIRLADRPIVVENDAVVLNPKYMTQGKFYPAVVNGEPYFYRRVDASEIEVYGFAR